MASMLTSLFDVRPISHFPKLVSNKTKLAYTHIFTLEAPFESEGHVDSLMKSVNDYWLVGLAISFLYIAAVHMGQSYMKSRPAFDLRVPLILWNVFLSVFSLVGAIRFMPEFMHTLTTKGVVASVCDSSYLYGIPGAWCYWFMLSKFLELFDTMFIVLRKQPLIFLHWYHHATVLIFGLIGYKDRSSSGRWFTAMNLIIHTIMYAYYACRAARVKLPVIVSQVLTTMQILQMVAGVSANLIVYNTLTYHPETKCEMSYQNLQLSSFAYFTYFLLFVNFFIQVYVFKSKPMGGMRASGDKHQGAKTKQLKKNE